MVAENQGKVSTHGDHKVTFTVTIAVAFPTDVESEPKPNNKGLGGFKGRRRVYEAPKPQNYYHLEYKLLPDDADVIKTDVVTYGVAAKIYTESDSKVMKTWQDGSKTWVAWTHRWVMLMSYVMVRTEYDLKHQRQHQGEAKSPSTGAQLKAGIQ